MDQAPERIWVDYTPHTESYQHVDTDNPQDGSTEYIRSDLADLGERSKEMENALVRMTDLKKIEKPYSLCTKEEQEGLKGLLSTPDALQHLGVDGKWDRLLCWDRGLMPHLTYRQSPDWQPPKLDVPDWFWEATEFNYVAMDQWGTVYAYKLSPEQHFLSWRASGTGLSRLDNLFAHHDFNPHGVSWDKSLTVRPGLKE